MKGCPEWSDAVADCALAGAAGPALAAHLAVCPGCADSLRESQRAVARMDAAVHRRTAVEPPVYGPDRIMACVSGRNRADTNPWWRWATVATVAAILIAIVLWTRRAPPQRDVAALVTWHSPTAALLRPPVPAAWNTMPQLGKGFFEVKTSGETHAQ
jgi:hypothetical protein